MAKDLVMIRLSDGTLQASDRVGIEYMRSLPKGRELGVTITQARNYEFHKKLFAILGWLYDTLPRVKAKYKGQCIEQSFETFRREFVAISGHYDVEVTSRLDNVGNPILRIEPQSISYAKCTEELAKQIYSDVIDKGLEKLNEVGRSMSKEELDKLAGELLRFDS